MDNMDHGDDIAMSGVGEAEQVYDLDPTSPPLHDNYPTIYGGERREAGRHCTQQ
jgi:hypothetical protein